MAKQVFSLVWLRWEANSLLDFSLEHQALLDSPLDFPQSDHTERWHFLPHAWDLIFF